MSRSEIILWVGVSQLVVGLSFSLAMDWLRERPGWPSRDSRLRGEGWVLIGLSVACLGAGSVAVGLFGL